MRRLIWTIVIGLALPAVAIALGGAAWPFELAYHFVGHLAVAAATALAACLLLRQRAPAFAAALAALTYGITAIGSQPDQMSAWAPAAAAEKVESLGLVSFNLNANQEDPGPMLAWLATGPADVLVLVESSPRWRQGFEDLRAVYPYQVVAVPQMPPRQTEPSEHSDTTDMAGVAVLSRLPLGEARVIYPAGPVWPAIVVELKTAGDPTTLAAAHPSKPLTPAGLENRDRYLEGLGVALAEARGPLIVAGDFNATRYTPAFRRLQSSLGLRLAPGAPATYPTQAGPLGLAIDHILVRGAGFDRLEPLPARGSDHRGLYARLAMPSGHTKGPGR